MEAALISATVALLIFTLGRWYEFRSAQTAFLRTKLEEYFCTLEMIHDNTAFPAIDIDWEPLKIQSAFVGQSGKLSRALIKPHMLAHLYFPISIPRFEQLVKHVDSLCNWMHDYGDPGQPSNVDEGMRRFQELPEAMVELKNYLVSEQPTLTKRIGFAS